MDKPYAKLIARQRDRAIAIILDFKERECDGYLTPEVSKMLRKVVLDQLNDFCVFCSELLNSLDEGSVVLNEVYLQRIDEMYELLAGDRNNE